jgi:hypothetical protein
LDYTFKRLGMEETSPPAQQAESSPSLGGEASTSEPMVNSPSPRHDIRALRDEKQPNSANEMAAIVAYYLADLVPVDERKTEIGTADIEKYFKQAGHPLPKAVSKTLQNAAAAGYLDSASRGLYSLNPVGHNLVAHGLPRTGSNAQQRPRRKRQAVSKTKKTTAKGKARRTKRQKK